MQRVWMRLIGDKGVRTQVDDDVYAMCDRDDMRASWALFNDVRYIGWSDVMMCDGLSSLEVPSTWSVMQARARTCE